mmetsp:Transcript_4237/g.14944  ORF Transcript_4237/g.14944 Transcript_4237/m.14944 type:complete len:235 (-) Transcript_4237:87-791(-)
MGYPLQAGCLLVAFSPLIALMLIVVTQKGQLVILAIGGAFFWMLSALVSGFLWWMIPPLRDVWVAVVFEGVLLQELFRLLFYCVYAKISISPYMHYEGRSILSTFEEETSIGVGIALAHTLIMYGSILWDASGPGSFYLSSCPHLPLYATSALSALFMSITDVTWTYIAFEGFRTQSLPKIGFVLFSHLAFSFLSILNTFSGAGMCTFSIAGTAAIAAVSTAVAVLALKKRYFR